MVHIVTSTSYKNDISSIISFLVDPKQKQKYRGMFETQKSGNKTSSGEIGLNIRALASPIVGQDQVSEGVSVLCWHVAPVANVQWKPLAIGSFSDNFNFSMKKASRAYNFCFISKRHVVFNWQSVGHIKTRLNAQRYKKD